MSVRRTLPLASSPIAILAVIAILLATAPVLAGTGDQPFIRGDSNADGAVNIGDAIATLAYLFSGGAVPACLDAADANDDGAVNIGDAIYTLAYLFSGGAPPPPPHPAPGLDPTSGPTDLLVCGAPCDPEELCNGEDDDCDGAIDEDPVDGLPWWPDADGDGYGEPGAPPLSACAAPQGHVGNSGDCDDDDPGRNPAAAELCNGVDDDCDGTTDEDPIDAPTWYPDLDGDGHGDPTAPVAGFCIAPGGTVAVGDDCDDADPTAFPGGTEICDGADDDCDGAIDEDAVDALPWWPDADGDGFGSAAQPPLLSCAAPPAHAGNDDDCDDADPTAFPGGTEICDGADDDCDGTIDENAVDALAWYPDADLDGHGAAGVPPTLACTAPAGHVASSDDCDDADPTAFPGAPEECDGADDDCDGLVDEDSGGSSLWWPDLDADFFGDGTAPPVIACAAPPGHVGNGDDCDDTDPNVNPFAREHCNGIDDDCTGAADEYGIDAPIWWIDADGDGYGQLPIFSTCVQPPGTSALGDDCDDTDPTVHPGIPELCNGLDEDCDFIIDEDAVDASTWYPDSDGDGYGSPRWPQSSCSPPFGHVANDDDCDDLNFFVNPGAPEFCNDADEDCDGAVDEDAVDAPAWYQDADGDFYGDPGVSVIACDPPRGYVFSGTDCDDSDPAQHPGAAEHCDGMDEDCDGLVDDSPVDATFWYPDADGDGYGWYVLLPMYACEQPPGMAANFDDCDDGNATVHFGAPEICGDSLDNDCDGTVDDLLDQVFEPAPVPPAFPGRKWLALPGGRRLDLAASAGGLDEPGSWLDPGTTARRLGSGVRADRPDVIVSWLGADSTADRLGFGARKSHVFGNEDYDDASLSTDSRLRSIRLSRAEIVHEETDLAVPGVGVHFLFTRTYRSRTDLGTFGALGPGWSHSYEIGYRQIGNTIYLRTGNHREETLELESNGVYYSRPGFPARARYVGDDLVVDFGNGGNWRLEPLPGQVYQGRIAEIRDAHGNALTCSYVAGEILATITDSTGRVFTFTYLPDGRLHTIDDGSGTASTYEYYAIGDPDGTFGSLRSVRTPPILGTPNGNDYPTGRTVSTYTYSVGQLYPWLDVNLLSITDANGNVTRFTHDQDPSSPTSDALLTWELDGGLWQMHHSCADSSVFPGAARRVMVNDDRGAVTEYIYDAQHRLLRERAYTGFADPSVQTTPSTNLPGAPLRPGDPGYFERRYEWTSDHRLRRVTWANGNETEFLYEADLDPSASPLERTNLRQVTWLAGTHSPAGSHPTLVETREYAPGFGGFHAHRFVTERTASNGATTTIVRDPLGQAIQVQHAVPGAVVDYEYDVRGRVTAEVRASHATPGDPPARRRDEYVYDPGTGLLASRTVDAGGLSLTTSYEVDPRGHVIRVVDPSGNDHLYVRNILGEVLEHHSRVFDLAGNRFVTRYWYDANGNRIRTDLQNRDADGAIVLANPWLTRIREYDPLDHLARTLDEAGSFDVPDSQLDGSGLPASEFVIVDVDCDRAGRPVLVRSGEATSGAQPDAVVAHLYDERGFLYRRTRGAGGPHASTDQYDYDGNGNVTAIRTGLEAGERVSTRVIDGQDRLIVATDPMGNVRTFGYDATGNRTSSRLDGELVDVPGGAGNIRLSECEWIHDALGRRIGEIALWFDPVTQLAIGDGSRTTTWVRAPNGLITRRSNDYGDPVIYVYDSAERPSRAIDALGNELELAYDADSNVITETHRDRSGATPGLVVSRVRTHAYDGLCRRITTNEPLGDAHDVAYAWYGIARSTDERGNVRRFGADSLGRIIRVESDLTADGTGSTPVVATAVHERQYDDNHRCTAAIDPNGNETARAYDALGRCVLVTRADGTSESATYDAHDQRLTEVDANGSLRSNLHDLLGRPTAVSILAAPGVDPGATFATFSRDGLGRIRAAENDDVAVARTFDSLGHLGGETVDGLAVLRLTDAEGAIESLTYPSGRVIDYATDPLGRVSTIAEGGATLASYQFLGPSLPETRVTADGSSTAYQYDLSRRLVQISTTAGGSSLLQHAYTWDPAGDLDTRVDSSPGGALSTSDYSYDSLERLVARQTTSTLGPPSLVSYLLDLAGDRLSVSGLPASGPYLRDPTLPEPADAQMHQYTQTPADARAYSAAGELLSATPLSPTEPERSFAYDALGRLRRVDPGTSPPTEYDYDPFGRLVRISSGTDVTRLARCGNLEIAAHDALGSEVASSVFGLGPSDRIGLRSSALAGVPTDYTLHSDSAGSIVLVTDTGGSTVERYEYGDHGQLVVLGSGGLPIPASLVGNAHLFHGHRRDGAAGIYLTGGGVFLDPGTGRRFGDLDNDTGAIDSVRWGVAAPASEYRQGNPTSGPALGIGDLDRDGRSDLVVPAWSRNSDGIIDDADAHHSHSRAPEIDRALYPDAWVQDDTPDGETVYDARCSGPCEKCRCLHSGIRLPTETDNPLPILSFAIEIDRALYPDAWVQDDTPDGETVYAAPYCLDPPGALSSLENDTGAIDFVRWGAVDVPSGTQLGSIELDDFESRRSLYIGSLD